MTSKHSIVTAMALTAAMSTALFAADQVAAPKPAREQAPAPAAAPKMTLAEPLKDFGTVPKGEKIDWTFAIQNTGNADLQLLSVQPGCGCTVAEFDKVIKPGETGKVVTHVDTTAFTGPISKYVTVQSNDPAMPTSQLTIHAVVKPYVDAYPTGFARYQMLQGESQTATIKLYSEEEAPFEITKIETPGDWIKVQYAKITDEAERAEGRGRPGQNQYRIDIQVAGPDTPIGPLAQKVHVFTNSKFQPEFPISIVGVIRPRVSIMPTVLNFGEVTPGETAAVRSILLSSNDKKDLAAFQVTKVVSSLPASFDANLKPTATPGEYEVEVKLAKNAKPGAIDGSVKIFTSDKVKPVIDIPVKGTIKKSA
jgi:hypothetical protein